MTLLPKCSRLHKRRLRDLARRHGMAIPRGYNWRYGRIGKGCRQLLLDVQKRWGIPLTGRFDARTLDLLYPKRFRQRVVKIAKAERAAGIQEKPLGSNAGPVIKYMRPFGVTHAAEWCGFGAGWVAVRAGFPKERLPKLVGWVDAWWVEALKRSNPHMVTVAPSRMRPGDFALIDYHGDNDPDHITICLARLGPLGTFVTLGGNEGHRWQRTVRRASTLHGAVRLRLYPGAWSK